MTLSDHQFQGVHEKLKAGGFTVNPRTGQDITSGISVAPRDNERTIPASKSTPGDIKQYTAENQDRFQRGSATMLGGWEDEGTHFLDTPTVHPHTPGGGGHARARRQMVLSHQIASMDLDKLPDFGAATEYNPFHPVGRTRLGMAGHELADAAHPKKGDSPERARQRSEFANKQPEVQAWVNSPRRLSRDPG